MRETRRRTFIALTGGLALFFLPVHLAVAADHGDAPLIFLQDSGEVLRCPEPLHYPIQLTIELPPSVTRRNHIAIKTTTHNAGDGSIDASDFNIWRQSYGMPYTTVIDQPVSQYTTGHLIFPAIEGSQYDAGFSFTSLSDGETCNLSATYIWELKPVHISSYTIGSAGTDD